MQATIITDKKTISVKQYTPDDKEVWNDFIKTSKNGIFMFNRNFMDYHSDRFQDNSLMFYEENELLALLPASIHNNEMRSHGGLTFGGFITNRRMKQAKMLQCFEVLKTYLKQNNIKRLIYKTIPYIYHKSPAQEDLYALFLNKAQFVKFEPSSTVALNIPYKMSKGKKAQISKARRVGVSVEESVDFNRFIDLENQVLQKYHNTKAVHTGEELTKLKNNFPDNIKLYVAKFNNEIIAGSVIFVYDNLVHTQYMAANELARENGALDLVIQELISKYKDTKTYFDFGISSENNGLYLNTGLIQQKESFGGNTVVYCTCELDIF